MVEGGPACDKGRNKESFQVPSNLSVPWLCNCQLSLQAQRGNVEFLVPPCLLPGLSQPQVQPGSPRGSPQPQLFVLGTSTCKCLTLEAARAA